MSGRKNSQRSNASSQPQEAGDEGKASRSLSTGVIVGRAAERLLELEQEEREALARSPEAIKAAFAKKREEVLAKLTEKQRDGAIAMANAMRSTDEAAAE